MARLPIPGGDDSKWGTILNDYLSQAHKGDGTLKDGSVGSAQLADNSVTSAAIADSTITETLLAGAVQTKLNQAAPTWGTLSGKPAVIAAGSTQLAAQTALGVSATGREVLTGDAAAGRKALRAADAAASGSMRNLMSKLVEGVSDATIVVNSDSTGATSDSWVIRTAQWLAIQFPAYTVNYYLWDEVGDIWPVSPTWTYAGTGAYTLTVWNAGVGGSSTGYFQGSRFPNLIKNADLVIVNHGFNQSGPVNDDSQRQYRRNMYLAFVDEFASANPNAGVVLIGQPPDGRVGREEWQAQKNLEYAKAAAWRGWGFVNVHRAWIEYGDWESDLTLGDLVHPTTAGQVLWASLVQSAMENAIRIPVTMQPATTGASAQVFRNPQLSAWAGSLPDGVTSATNCTVTKELTDFETGVQAMKITSTATPGFAYVELTGTAEQWGVKGRLANNTYTAAVRLKVPAANTGTIRVALLDNNGSTYTMASDVSPTARGRYIWVYATKSFPSNATSLTMWIIARTSGTAIVDITVDEIRLSPGASAQPAISSQDTLGALSAANNDFPQRVSGAWVPRTPAQVRTALDLDAEVLTNAQACLPVGSINSAITMTSGTIVFGYFVAEQNVTIANLAASSSSTAAAATPTLVRMGVYSCDASGNLVLLAGTTSDTALFASIGTEYSKALTAPVALVKGERYAYGLLIVSGATMPTIMAQAAVGSQGVFARATNKRPRRSSALGGQTDLPSNVSSGSVASKNGIPFILGTT